MNPKVKHYEFFVALIIIANILIFYFMSKRLEAYMIGYYANQSIATQSH